MSLTQDALDRFLATFEHNANQGAPGAVAAQFAGTFIAAGPAGPMAVRASDFQQALVLRKLAFEKAGCKSSKLISKKETLLGDRFAVLDTYWRFEFAPENGPAWNIETRSSFFLDMGGDKRVDAPKILVYAAHQDILKLLKGHEISSQADASALPHS
jgi:hypothetical protein